MGNKRINSGITQNGREILWNLVINHELPLPPNRLTANARPLCGIQKREEGAEMAFILDFTGKAADGVSLPGTAAVTVEIDVA